VVFAVLRTVYEYFKFAWARSLVEEVFKEAAMRRHQLSKPHRDVMDRWTNTLTARKSSRCAAATPVVVVDVAVDVVIVVVCVPRERRV
jgi:hypothetical protein